LKTTRKKNKKKASPKILNNSSMVFIWILFGLNRGDATYLFFHF
jgi:hypothetical protein